MTIKINHRQHSTCAFTRVDLLALIAVIVLLAGWFGFSHLGERGRVLICTRNLRILGEAMESFANDHGNALPVAGIEQPSMSWDVEIAPYLQNQPLNLGAKSPGAKKQATQSQSTAHLFLCPSDPIERKQPRSYAMSMHNMLPENWPPGPDNETGAGLVWTKDRVNRLVDQSIDQNISKPHDESLLLVKSSWMPDPANTLLLTELFHPDNRLGRWGHVVTRTEDQVNAINGDGSKCHSGRFSYLMLDGHVELLSPLQTGSWRGDRGIWTIKTGD